MKSYDNYVRVCAVITVLTLILLAGEVLDKGGQYNHHTEEKGRLLAVATVDTREPVRDTGESVRDTGEHIRNGGEKNSENPRENINEKEADTQEAEAQAAEAQKTAPQETASALRFIRTQGNIQIPITVSAEQIDRTLPERHVTPRVIEQECLFRQRLFMSDEERDILYRIVQAEAGGEDALGKKMVADVIVNRVLSGKFPNSVTEVVFQHSGGKVQFSPTRDGRIYRVRVSEATREAVDEAILEEDHTGGALYFVATSRASQDKVSWFDRALTNKGTHGGHTFYR